MVEVYNEQVRDILSSDSASKRYPFTFSFIFLPTLLFLFLPLCFVKLRTVSLVFTSRKNVFFLDLHTLGILSTSQSSGLSVPDASMHTVTKTSDVLNLMEIGLKNRAKSSTAMNERSSRSHRSFISNNKTFSSRSR